MACRPTNLSKHLIRSEALEKGAELVREVFQVLLPGQSRPVGVFVTALGYPAHLSGQGEGAEPAHIDIESAVLADGDLTPVDVDESVRLLLEEVVADFLAAQEERRMMVAALEAEDRLLEQQEHADFADDGEVW